MASPNINIGTENCQAIKYTPRASWPKCLVIAIRSKAMIIIELNKCGRSGTPKRKACLVSDKEGRNPITLPFIIRTIARREKMIPVINDPTIREFAFGSLARTNDKINTQEKRLKAIWKDPYCSSLRSPCQIARRMFEMNWVKAKMQAKSTS